MADPTTGGTAQAQSSGGLLQWLVDLLKRVFGGSSSAGHATPAPATASTPNPPSAPSTPAATTPAASAPAAAAPGAQAVGQSSSSTVVQNPGWEEDIVGIFYPFVEQMAWRFNLGSYEDVRANATIILGRINGGGMPPPNYPPLSDDAIQTYTNWVNNDCPLNRPPTTTSTTTVTATTLAGNQQKRPIKFP